MNADSSERVCPTVNTRIPTSVARQPGIWNSVLAIIESGYALLSSYVN